MPYASTPTLLSPSRFARILGLGGMHFAQGVSQLLPDPRCSDIWYQNDWQDPDKVSREQMGMLVAQAERDIADELGYWPAPTWIRNELIEYPRPQRKELYGLGGDVRLRWKTVQTRWGHLLYGGRRATLLGGTTAYTLVDADGDGFTELAKFEVLDVSETLDVCNVKAYFKEYSEGDASNSRTDPASSGADASWEVRPIRVTLSGTTLTIWTNVWNLFRPQLQESLRAEPIDADDFGDLGVPTDAGSYVDALVFYEEYADTENYVQFLWRDAACGKQACAAGCQHGCFQIQNRRLGLVIPQPSVYNDDDGTHTPATWSGIVEPDALRVWYKAGATPTHQQGCDRLDRYWAKTIVILAVARTDWPLCTCTNVELLTDFWKQDARKATRDKSFQVTQEDLENPFGTRIGEILAWRRVCGRGRRKGQAVVE